MTVLVAGGAGFIGSHVVEALRAQGQDVVVFDNFLSGRRENLASVPEVEIIEGDIANRDQVQKVFDQIKPSHVVHAAASYNDPNDWQRDVLTNTLGMVNLVQASEATSVKRFVYYQTCLCYGTQPETLPMPLSHPLHPENSSYSISKTAGEQYLRLSSLSVVSFRLANILGPRNLSGPVPVFFQRLSENKPCFVVETKRDFVFVGDLVELTVQALLASKNEGCYHVSSGQDYPILDVYTNIRQAMGLPEDLSIEIRERSEDDAVSLLTDPQKTLQDFGWKTKTSLSETIQKAVSWYQEHGVAHSFTHLSHRKKS